MHDSTVHDAGSSVMTIGEVARLSGVTPKMIRHYESLGLLPGVARSQTGYRHYDGKALHELRFIRQARNLGFSLPHIAELLDLWRDRQRSSQDVKRLAEQQLLALTQKIAELQQMQLSLQSLVTQCHGDERAQCPILEGLAGEPEASAVENVPRGIKKSCHDPAG